MESFEVETFCTMLAQKSQSQREDQDLASQIVVAKGERGILTEQLALKLLRSFRGIDAGFETSFDYVVLGCLSHGHTFQRHLGPSIAEAIGIRLISHHVAFTRKATRLYD